MSWRLHTYFALLIGLFVLAAVAALLVVRIETRDDALDSALADAGYAATKASGDLNRDVIEGRAIVATTAANPAIVGLLEQPAGCTLSFSKVGTFVGSINVLSPEGAVACSSDSGPFKGYAGAPWLVSALTAPVTTGPFAHPDTGRQVFVVAAPVDGKAIFAAVVELEPVAAALADRYGGARRLEFVIVSPDGTTVMSRSSEPHMWAGTPLEETDFGGDLALTERKDLDGTTRLYQADAVETLGWQVHAGADRSAALAASERVFQRFSAAILAGLLVALLGAAVAYLATARPIRRLNQAIAKASASPTEAVKIEPAGPVEIAALAAEFNNLTASVRSEFQRREQAVAERDQLEQQLSRAQRLESLGQLAGGVAHDFNNMLGVVLNYAGFVKEEVADAAHEDDQRWGPVVADVGEIETAVHRASALTRQLLAFARCDIPKPSCIQPNDTISALSTLLTRTLGENVSLRLSLADSVPAVRIDPGKLEQVVVNLAVNARDAMPAGGTLVIDSASVEVDAEVAALRPGLRPGPYVRLRVSDTGTGMEQSTIDRAFEPLFTTKSVGHGTGLGLSTVYGIVTQAGGSVSIYSELGHGTTFNVFLPVADDASSEESVTETPPSTELRGSETILVVEDDQASMEVATRILNRSGYRTLAAMNGGSAIQIASQYTADIDLLVTDLVLPDMAGEEVAQLMRLSRPEIKVIYASGYATPVLGGRFSLEPGTLVLEKPFPANELLGKVRAALIG